MWTNQKSCEDMLRDACGKDPYNVIRYHDATPPNQAGCVLSCPISETKTLEGPMEGVNTGHTPDTSPPGLDGLRK